MTTISKGIKTIQIHAQTRYPVVSAYEFEFLKSEKEIQALLKPCTIYFILQRPLLYFDNLCVADGKMTFSITDDSNCPPLECTFIPSENGFCKPDEELLIDIQFYKKTPDKAEPFNDVSAFKLCTLKNVFLGWFSPSKFLYEVLDRRLKANIIGNISDYLDFQVHYIGKAFSQDIWNRLTGHHKMQSILTLEDSLNQRSLRAPLEISLLMLDIDGYDEGNIFPTFEFALQPGIEPIVYTFSNDEDDPRFDEYYEPKLPPRAPELTSEVEAILVSTFKPKYNEVLFENYPDIKAGTRSAGYTQSTLLIEKMPAILRTEHHVQGLVLPV
ncbi:hypothetical protein SAMN05216201_11040 [Pseudomonas linyingensis]|uniref:Uncharacterized protein n=1 Tax=Pseudomonas linyingensis TaxID=915471 RepID=A0A1H6ZEX0_9PSED|nr:hypothetical protein [Pseudomonas linyingensis]SEJ51921.1 hypothetical protein SAMN05216201_11040 [Pseudomonas linyingensis]